MGDVTCFLLSFSEVMWDGRGSKEVSVAGGVLQAGVRQVHAGGVLRGSVRGSEGGGVLVVGVLQLGGGGLQEFFRGTA